MSDAESKVTNQNADVVHGNTPPQVSGAGEPAVAGSIAAQDRAQIAELKEKLFEKDNALAVETTKFAEKLTGLDADLADQIGKVVDRDVLLVQQAQGIRDRDEKISGLAQQLRHHSAQLALHIEDIKTRDLALLSHAQTIRERNAKIVSLEAQLQTHSAQLAAHIAMVQERDAKLATG